MVWRLGIYLYKKKENLLKDNDFRVCEHLLEVITRQEEVIARQNKLIAKLANENFEQENMINVLMQESSQLSDSDS
jgi:hypothetical protein